MHKIKSSCFSEYGHRDILIIMATIKPSKEFRVVLSEKLAKDFLDSFFCADTARFQFGEDIMEPSEIEAGNLLSEYLKPKQFVRIPKVDVPEGIHTPDFLIDSVKYEVKAPKSIKKIDERIREGMRQVGKNGWIVLSDYNYKGNSARFLSETLLSARQNKLKGLYFISNHKIEFIEIKK